MQALLEHVFWNELRIDPAEHAIFMTEAPLNPKNNREKMTQIMFETVNVPAFYVGIDAMLGMYASGRTTGIILQVHTDYGSAVPIYEGYALPHAMLRLDLGMQDVVDEMARLLAESGYTLTTTAEKALVRFCKYSNYDEPIHCQYFTLLYDFIFMYIRCEILWRNYVMLP